MWTLYSDFRNQDLPGILGVTWRLKPGYAGMESMLQYAHTCTHFLQCVGVYEWLQAGTVCEWGSEGACVGLLYTSVLIQLWLCCFQWWIHFLRRSREAVAQAAEVMWCDPWPEGDSHSLPNTNALI